MTLLIILVQFNLFYYRITIRNFNTSMYKKIDKKTVIICGKGSLAIKVASWFLKNPDYKLLYIVPVIPEKTWTKSVVLWAKKNKVKIIRSGEIKDIPEIKNPGWKIDLVVSVFYENIFKESFIKKCKKIINIHNAPLPKYRGVSPINWALKNKEHEHGVTIHEITPGIDDGPIISQVKYSIFPDLDTVENVYKRSLRFAWMLFLETIPILDQIKPIPQDDNLATYYSKNENGLLGQQKLFKKKNY